MNTPPLPAGYALDQPQAVPPLPAGYKLDSQPAASQSTESPGSRDRVLSSYGEATKQGIDNIAQGVSDAVSGIYNTVRHPIDTAKGLIAAPGRLIDQIKQVPGAISDINRSADPLGSYANVAAKTSGQAAGQAIVAGAGAALPEAAGSLASKGGQASTGLAERLYQSALKPSAALPASRVAGMVQTGLEQGIPVSAAGVEKIGSLIDDLNGKIKATIAADPTRPIDVAAVAQRVDAVKARFANQVNPGADMQAIDAAKQEFLQNNPGTIGAADAQAMKSGTYQQLKGKAYGELKSATIESQKALARGLKEELVNAFPELKDLNANDSKLLNLEPVLEKAVQRLDNHQMLGVGTPIAAAAGKVITGSAAGSAVAGIMKLVIDNPIVKSRLAIALSRAGGANLLGAGQRVQAYSAALADAAANAGDPGDRTNSQ